MLIDRRIEAYYQRITLAVILSTMADIDDLLQEVEGALQSTASHTPTASTASWQPPPIASSAIHRKPVPAYSGYAGAAAEPYSAPHRAGVSAAATSPGTADSELDALLSALPDTRDSWRPAPSAQHASSAPTPAVIDSHAMSRLGATSGAVRKCWPPAVGPMSYPRGINSRAREAACDALRCTACDFDVLCIPHAAWAADTDYMFLRNFMPDVARLRAKLVDTPGGAAYGCQCHWVSVAAGDPLEPLQTAGSLPTAFTKAADLSSWRCAGHPTSAE